MDRVSATVTPPMTGGAWQFWIDRGGTFTDVIGRDPDGILHTHKLLSVNPGAYPDAVLQGMRDVLGVDDLSSVPIETVKVGTTVGTNALLEHRGARTAWVTTQGHADALRIGTQARPDLFALAIELPEPLYEQVIEVPERIDAQGNVIEPLDTETCRLRLQTLRASGIQSLAIGLLHGYRYPQHEAAVAAIARELGFEHVSVSHRVSPLIKWVPRGHTTVLDAYLSPILDQYTQDLQPALPHTRILFMQSGGGLVEASAFRGKDCLLSGPAGGVVGMVTTANALGFDRLIGFDMGGTSTDVCHYAGEFERTEESEVHGLPVRAPMMRIHTVAAGGGSVLHFDGERMRVGPDSAGADPGPASYGQGGPLTVTDCQVALGTLRPEYFPAVLGPDRSGALDRGACLAAFEAMRERYEGAPSAMELAEGFLAIAVENMAGAIRRISVQRGYDVTEYALVSFGGAGGQHACLVAERLGMQRIVVHPMAGVLSALGIGHAQMRAWETRSVERPLEEVSGSDLQAAIGELKAKAGRALEKQGVPSTEIQTEVSWQLRYEGSDTALRLPFESDGPRVLFDTAHRKRFGFLDPGRKLVLAALTVEASTASSSGAIAKTSERTAPSSLPTPVASHPVHMDGRSQVIPFYARESLQTGQTITGPAVILEPTGTTVVRSAWEAQVQPEGSLLLGYTLSESARRAPQQTTQPSGQPSTLKDPLRLELFANRFQNIAEEMGLVLQNTAASVNIKERLDFSCAVFNRRGELIANAPHIPVHLGSMGACVKDLMQTVSAWIPGEVFASNAPYHGGTHLPDVTVIQPVFTADATQPAYFVAARGHHADIGGRVPGSAPADSRHIEEEGILLHHLCVVSGGRFQEEALRERLSAPPYPARNPDQNIADLRAQVAACETGARALRSATVEFGHAVVDAYMEHLLDHSEACVRRALRTHRGGRFSTRADDGHRVQVSVSIDATHGSATFDFAGSSGPHPGNFNAPPAIARAASLYVLRCLLDEGLPLNDGCLRPVELRLPHPSWLSPESPSAVFAGNVETSQLIVDALLGALGVAAGSQGTMNNVLWGNDEHQYYETLCGGAGATPDAPGASAVQTHMTNSRLTDPEVLEWRYPVRVESFELRRGSGGSGQQPGGDGVVRRIRFLEPMQVNLVTGRRIEQPPGLAGGGPGQSGSNQVHRADGTTQPLTGVDRTELRPGDVLEIRTPGGGAFGVR